MDAIAAQTRSTPKRRHTDRDRRVSIRPIERSDASGLSDFYARLSTESRHRRFLSYGRPSADELGRIFTSATGHGFVGILSEAGPDDGAIVAHASVQPAGDGSAEIAFAVADELQGRGIGRRLMHAVVEDARTTGVRRLSASLLADNVPMRRLLTAAGEIVSDSIDLGIEEVELVVTADR
jgi:GNAT superfamily N-acetyltransferase